MDGFLLSGVVTLTAFQAVLMLVDEWVYHRRRGLPPWERLGHPVDSFFFALALATCAWAPPTESWLIAYVVLAVISCAVISKDEWVHASQCEPGEHWIHALLFVVHPSVLWGVGLLWLRGDAALLRMGLPIVIFAYGIFQAVFWLTRKSSAAPKVDNLFYDDLGARWYDDDTHAIALLRVESVAKLAYVKEVLEARGIKKGSRLLDVGCGAGFISNPLAEAGYQVKGIDLSAPSIEVARSHAPKDSDIAYESQNAYALKEVDRSFDVVLMLDFLEHVDEPNRAIAEAARVLKPGGLLVFHTFNRTPLAWFLAVKGIQFVARDCPSYVHVYHLFLKPRELEGLLNKVGLAVKGWRGIRPKVFHKPFFWSVWHRRVHPKFAFVFTKSRGVGYLGYAVAGSHPEAVGRQDLDA